MSSYSSQALKVYLRKIASSHHLPKECEKKLIEAAQKGDMEARNSLIHSHLRFVIMIAKNYRERGLPFEDLVAEGNTGLIRAVDKFDRNRDVKFISYAVWWIRQAILLAISEKTRDIRVPINQIKQLNSIDRMSGEFSQELGYEPMGDDIAKRSGIEQEKIDKLRIQAANPLSLNGPLNGEDGIQLLDVVEDTNLSSPEEEYDWNLQRAMVSRMLGKLNDRDQTVLKLYFGFETGECKTLAEIGSVIGVSKERVRQIKLAALSKCRGMKPLTGVKDLNTILGQ